MKLNFGAGTDFKKDFDNIDKEDFDFNCFPYPIESDTYDYIYCNHVLEHLERPELVLKELHRITKNGGIIEINVPHFNCEGAFSEVGHISFFSEYWFIYFVNPRGWEKRKEKFILISVNITPTRFGRFIPKELRRSLALLLRGIQSEMNVKLKVLK